MSSKFVWRYLLLLLGVWGCGTGISAPDAAPDLETKLQVTLDSDTLDYALDDVPLVASIYWVSSVDVPDVCLLPEAQGLLDDLCPDPFLLSGEWVANSITLEPDVTRFEIGLDALPPFNVVVGDVNGRAAYAAVVVFSDADNDGFLNLDVGVQRGKGRSEGKEGEEDWDNEMQWVSDRLVASSFYHLREPQARLIHVEGDYRLDGNFLPAMNCDTPPTGFSLLKNLTKNDSGELNDCQITTLDEDIPLFPLGETEEEQFMCLNGWTDWGPPPGCDPETDEWLAEDKEKEPMDYTHAICVGDDLLVLPFDESASCGEFQVFGLAGCWSGITCEDNEWDCRAAPPADWPCP
mgnify:CR=1 FL=1